MDSVDQHPYPFSGPPVPVSTLRLSGMQRSWEPGENTAHCNGSHSDDVVPVRSCGCGFWAYWETLEAGRHMSNPDVVGIIEGYGHVIAGTKGLRCSKARVTALCVLRVRDNYGNAVHNDPAWRAGVMTALHEVYGVPIYDDEATMLRAHPPTRGRVAEWAQARPQDAAAAQLHALKFPLGDTTTPKEEPPPVPCVICGLLAPGGATCDECARLASLATRLTLWFKCGCGAAREVSLEIMEKSKGDIHYRCHCGVEMTLTRPTLTPAQALAELKRRAGNWTVH